ncbi:MAG TPA: hypothetical protein PKO15_03860 [Fibrobacteria bacterium]|nr:hypothetical protein [Fibrobacteria bacterium]
MTRELAERYVKYIAEMANRLERKSWIDVDEVAALNRELELFKKKLEQENGPQSRQFLDLSKVTFRLDPRHLEGSSQNGLGGILGALGKFGVLGFLVRSNTAGTHDNRQRIQDFKTALRGFVYTFDDYTW